MRCHYCGKEVWLVRHLLDGDFCSPAHRKKYHERLRRSLQQLPGEAGPPGPVAGFRCEIAPADSSAISQWRYFGLQSSLPGPFFPKYNLRLAPRFGQSFFGPAFTSVSMTPGTPRQIVLQPVVAPPLFGPLGRHWNLAVSAAIATRSGFFALRPLNEASTAALLPLRPAPAPRSAPPAEALFPSLALRVICGESLSGDPEGTVSELPARDLRHIPLASWRQSTLDPILATARIIGTPEFQPLVAAPISTRNGSGLRLAACAPPACGSALLAKDSIARGNTRPAGVAPMPLQRQAGSLLPAIAAGPQAGPAPGKAEAIWKIHAAAPWTLPPQVCPDNLAAAPAAAMLPALSLVPVRPGLAAKGEVRRLEAGPREMLAGAARAGSAAPATPERAALPPAMTAPAVVAALPQAGAPRPLRRDAVVPQERPVPPGRLPEIRPAAGAGPHPAVLQEFLAPCIENCAAPAAADRLRSAGPMATGLPAFVPQAAVPRYRGDMLPNPAPAHTAIPDGTASGFGWKTFAAVAPQPVNRTLRKKVPEAAAIRPERICLRAPEIPIAGTALPPAAGEIPLDLYVQRIKCSAKRGCAWLDLPTRIAAADALPGVSPARFEQLVLQDWRRRYPARQIAITPAPISGGKKVVPIARHLSALARLQQNAPHFFKATAAALLLGAVLWMSWSTQKIQKAYVADRQWLKQAIAKRATLVLDDNFRSGLNLWEGRKNWARSWSYSPDGFMHTGQLALYRPTLKMDNYRLEFFAQIESKSVGWVFRAQDEQNYYAMKLSVTEPGPRPLVSVVRYPVLAGKRGKKVQIPLPIMMHNNTPYHVALDVKGTRFRAFIEDQEVDSWNDERLRAGGVGFFSENGERARLYWVKVSNHTDWLGRLCGMLSGGTTQNEAGLWNPADPNGAMAALDLSGIRESGKSVDRKRGVPILPFATVLAGSAR